MTTYSVSLMKRRIHSGIIPTRPTLFPSKDICNFARNSSFVGGGGRVTHRTFFPLQLDEHWGQWNLTYSQHKSQLCGGLCVFSLWSQKNFTKICRSVDGECEKNISPISQSSLTPGHPWSRGEDLYSKWLIKWRSLAAISLITEIISSTVMMTFLPWKN